MTTVKWTPLEHLIKKNLTQSGFWGIFQDKHLIIAVSGGADSVAALLLCLRFRKIRSLKISVLHIHHGSGGNQKFRDEALVFIKKLCRKLELPLIVKKYTGSELKSEEQMRNFRQKQYAAHLKKLKADFVVTGHHSDDLLETRLMRLIRGTGIQGLQSMTYLDGSIFRPFLMQTRQQIEEYLEKLQQNYVQDPSNLDTQYLRNWVRHNWLPALEQHNPGGTFALSRSLDLIAKSAQELKMPQDIWTLNGILRTQFMSLNHDLKKVVLVEYLKKLKMKDFRYTQIEEIIKRLDKRQIEYKFTMLSLCWVVNAEQITVE